MEIRFLHELQQQENNYEKLLVKITTISEDDQIDRLIDEYAKLKEEYAVLSEKKAEIERGILQKKSQCRRLEESKSNYENLIYTPEINSVKKLETLEKQIDDVQKSIELEMDNIDVLRNSLNEVANQIVSVKKKMAFIKKKYETIKANKKEELNFLINEKENIKELIEDIKLNIDEDLYTEYVKMKERLTNPIAEISSRKCSGCNMELPAMDYEAVKLGNSLKCQNCGRILVFKKK
ncbi:MAG: C4-type zinc ribbon domain-containing protein [Lutispora sp.]|nr:C4-type zinc ribbon domain-containing protein [Lutispora sp.]MDD4833310.1 C4-type zinc ribbon domain-containing protein [Lutispora sp.]